MNLSRRTLIGAGAASLAACAVSPKAAPAAGDWRLGYRTAPAGGHGPAPMRLVSGRAPAGLAGALYRNGPAQFGYRDKLSEHWFDGDGLVHRIAIGDGKAVHAARFVETPKRRAEQAAGKFLAPGFGTQGDPAYPVQSSDDTNAANTSVVMSGGELLALWEGGSAWRLDPVTLESRGAKVWRPDLKGMPFLAHPKREPDGRLWNLGTSGSKVGIWRIGVDGALEDFGVVDIGARAYIHDWAMTERKLIILVQPWLSTRDLPPFINGFVWKPEQGLKLLVVDKDDFSKRRWAQAPARSFYHTGAAWEEADGTIRLDAALYAEPVLGQGGGAAEIRGEYDGTDETAGVLTQIVIPPAGDAKLYETDLTGEFPQVDPLRHGEWRRLTVLVTGGAPGRPGATALSVHDWSSGKSQTHEFGAHVMVEEHLFVPKPGGRKEDDAWLIGTALNTSSGATEVSVFDAARVADGPIAVWAADYSWPLGFHGTWAGA